jgi:hypothetical protein
MAPWSRLDERFYRAILNSRLAGRYQPAADGTDNVTQDLPGYRRRCVAWHLLEEDPLHDSGGHRPVDHQ